ncbi:apoptotic chromatin condensation inducer acinus isoform X4 [Lycorma delicatula]|uniref:apoptotic chromatin condensation inducer acinus isoform X4 n=1 Tax=Lycorma delicatula TaxID=130591 RepID=UPI003F51216C
MKRKNKRHDSKGTPEKSPEKPSRRSNRHSKRRRKSSSSSSSPEREKVHTKSKDAAVKDSSAKGNEKVRSYTPELVTEKVNKEVIEKNVEQEAGSSRHSSKRHSGSEAEIDKLVKKDEGGGDNEWKEDKSFWEGDEKVEVETVDNKGKEKESAGSVWKVQSANGAGGEIQKLKICRQRMAEAQEDSEDSRRSSPKRRNEKESSSVNGTSDDDSNDSDESDCDGKGLKRKKRRKDGIQSAVTRQQRAATESPPRSQECESTSGKQEPEEEGEIEEGEAADEEEEKDTKSTPIASDKENTVVASQSSLISGTPVEPVQRKRRWGASKTIRPPKKPVLCISTDSLKNLIPEAKPIPIEEVRLSVEEDTERDQEQEERERSNENKEAAEEIKKKEKKEVKKERERHRDKEKVKDEKKVRDREKREKEPTKPVTSEKPSTDKVNRRICVLSEDARKLVRSPSPARHRPSSVLFITNLVRPFTVPQLRNLLARTGKIAENGFWIDKIKSKCYVQYTDEEAAIETRHALHGVRWPVSNPRTLCVEFASYDDMAVAQALSEETEPIPRKAEPLKVDHSVEGWLADQARINDRSQRRVVREWDVGKPAHPDEELDVRPSRPGYEDIRDRERERDREIDRDRDRRSKKERSHRSRTPDMHEPPARKPRRKDEDAPAKLLDDLFRKTKTSPCIYWLPLTAEQIVVKEEMRRQHMAEHERRYAEIRKAEQAARKDRDRRRK